MRKPYPRGSPSESPEARRIYYASHREEINRQRREAYPKNRDRIIAQVKSYEARNREKVRAYRRRWHTQRIKSSPEYRLCKMWLTAKQRAKKYGVEFSITKAEIKVPEFCPVFGFKLEASIKGHSRSSPSLDRIDPAKGYIPGNIQVISYLANAMKQDATREQLMMFAKWIIKEK